MNEPQDNQLDHLLQDWARSRAASTGDLISLQRRIKERILTENTLSGGPPLQTVVTSREGGRFFSIFVGIAAACLIAFFGWWYLRPSGQDDFAKNVPASTDRARVLTEYQEVFGPELSWFVEQPSRSEIGLRLPGSQPAATPNDFVAVRLLLFARQAGDQEWKEIQALDVVARREEVVEVVAESDRRATLTLWAYPLDEKMISIDLRYEPSRFAGQVDVPADMAIESSSLQSLGELAPVSSFEREGVEYRLYQSAILLPEKGVG